jgi:hypothetical protein
MMKQKLTKGQILSLRALAEKREQVISVLKELAEAEQDQLHMLVKFYDLPEDKEYTVTQEGDEVFLVEKPVKSE